MGEYVHYIRFRLIYQMGNSLEITSTTVERHIRNDNSSQMSRNVRDKNRNE